MSSEVSAYLEREVGNRPAIEELERCGIMKPGGNIADARSALERNLNRIHINQKMEQRPDYEDLIQANIAYDNSLAPSLQANARALERNIRCDRLNEALQTRQRPDIPADNVAPRLAAAMVDLEQAMARDKLKQQLERRPSIDELLKNNILKAPQNVAPSLHAAKIELEKQLRAERLNEFLAKREAAPAADVAGVAPSLQGAQRDLQRNLAKSNLYHALTQRPSKQEMEQAGLLMEAIPPTPTPADSDVEACSQVTCGGASTDSPLPDPTGPSRTPYSDRARCFSLTRMLLKLIVNLSDGGELSALQKGLLKDMVVSQDPSLLAAADVFDTDGDMVELKDTLLRISLRR